MTVHVRGGKAVGQLSITYVDPVEKVQRVADVTRCGGAWDWYAEQEAGVEVTYERAVWRVLTTLRSRGIEVPEFLEQLTDAGTSLAITLGVTLFVLGVLGAATLIRLLP